MSEIKNYILDYISAQRELLDIFEQRVEELNFPNDQQVLFEKIDFNKTIILYFDSLKDAKTNLDKLKIHVNDYGVINMNKIIFECFGVDDDAWKGIYFDSLSTANVKLINNKIALILPNYKEDNYNETNEYDQ